MLHMYDELKDVKVGFEALGNQRGKLDNVWGKLKDVRPPSKDINEFFSRGEK